jgi:zinc transport system ATP-binding protein
MGAVVACRELSFGYDSQPVLRGVSFEVPVGGFVGLVGPNGCGKSTVMRLLLGRLVPGAGELSVLGLPPAQAVRTGRVGYVPQRDTFARDFPLSVLDVVVLGRSGRLGLGRRPRAADWDAAREALATFGLTAFAGRGFGELSGGQQRLVLLARALAQEPRLLLMDEADTGLDERRRSQVYHALDDLRRRSELAIVAVSHQLDLLSTVVDSAVALRDGVAVDWCPTHMTHPLAEHAGVAARPRARERVR